MKRRFPIILSIFMALSSISLIVLQIVQMHRSSTVSDKLFNVSVNNAMEQVVSILEQTKVEQYVGRTERVKMMRYRRIDDFNARMAELMRDNEELFFDERRITLPVALQDSAVAIRGAWLSKSEQRVVNQYNTLLNARRRIEGTSNAAERRSLYGSSGEGIMNADFNYRLLDSLVVEQLIVNGIDIFPSVGVLRGQEFLYSSGDSSDLRSSPYVYPFRPGGLPSANDYFITLSFSTNLLILRNNQPFFTVSSLVLIAIILVIFFFSLHIIFSQRKLDEMKSTFINNMTHEVKTPISTIGLACEMLSDDSIKQDDAMRKNFIGMIAGENQRMRMLVETILQSSKMSNKHYSINPVSVDVNALVRDVARSFDLTIRNRNGSLVLSLDDALPAIDADKLHISNLISNLVDNAVKYSLDAPHITVATHADGQWILLSVSDQGIGIAKADQKHIFDKFYRVSTGDVHNVKGFGIGLNYVWQVVNLHHGFISVDSVVGQGTTFSVRLPRF